MQRNTLKSLLITVITLVIGCLLITGLLTHDKPGFLQPLLVYVAIIAPLLCQIFPASVARVAWIPTLGIFLFGVLTGLERYELEARVWFEILLLAIMLVAYAVVVNRAATWDDQLIRALSFVSRNDLAIADAMEFERLKRSEGVVALCQRLNQPLSVLHLNWMRAAGEEGENGEWSFASQFERLSMRECVLKRVGSAIRNSDIVLSDGTQNGLFVICPATPERGAEVLSGRLEAVLQREFAARVWHSIVTTDDHGFVLADLMIAARTSKATARSVEYGTVVPLR